MRRFLVATSLAKFRHIPHIHAKILVGALLISNGIRRDVEVLFHLTDVEKSVKIVGARVKRLFPDEDSAVGFLKKVFTGKAQSGAVVDSENLTIGTVMGAGSRRCEIRTPFTYVVQLERIDVDIECGVDVGSLPPHHQVVVVNVMTDRMGL